jgi:CubicO group peptidase (beta-lactamase class C family)
MKKITLILLTLGLTQASCIQETLDSKVKKINDLIERYSKLNKFNGSVLIARRGDILLAKGVGFKNAGYKTLNDTNSIFQIYSITKTFTSVVIFKLIELNKLSLNDKLSKFYPKFPMGDAITIEHLLTHSSGIYDYTREEKMPDCREQPFVNFLASKPLDFLPGTNWSYSNSGYYLLGFIIAKLTGVSYEQAVRQFILQPSGMRNSGFDFKNLSLQNKTTGYSIFTNSFKKQAILGDSTGPFAAGAIYSTVGDLFRFHCALQTYKIISKASLDKAYRGSERNEQYGHGWQIREIGSLLNKKKVVWHGGGAAGFRSSFARIPEDDICIVLLNNHESANTEFITKNVIDILYDNPVPLPNEIKLKKEVLEQLAGAYASDGEHPLILYISITDERLAIQVSGQGKTTLLAQKENYFSQEEAEAFVEFTKEGDGSYNKLIVHQKGSDLHAKKLPASWGIIGDATAIGWQAITPDIPFQEDPKNKRYWLIRNINLVKGEFKFRYNNDWFINYGDNDGDHVLDEYGANIKTDSGVYNITLDFTIDGKPSYIISKAIPE